MRAEQAHPRLRGEHALIFPKVLQGNGSSPLTRGAHSLFVAGEGWKRLIPAYAGSTARMEVLTASERGSSPLTRGAPPKGSPSSCVVGLIPAYAGSTDRCS